MYKVNFESDDREDQTVHTVLVCPFCNNPHIRPLGVVVAPVGKSTGTIVVDPDGVRPADACPPRTGRWMDVAISFEGKCGHRFALLFQSGHMGCDGRGIQVTTTACESMDR